MGLGGETKAMQGINRCTLLKGLMDAINLILRDSMLGSVANITLINGHY